MVPMVPMVPMQLYTKTFYERSQQHRMSKNAVVVSVVLKLLHIQLLECSVAQFQEREWVNLSSVEIVPCRCPEYHITRIVSGIYSNVAIEGRKSCHRMFCCD